MLLTKANKDGTGTSMVEKLIPGWCQHCRMECADRYGDEVYPGRPDLAKSIFWVCVYCGARVGSHPDGKPLGTAANEELRRAREYVHSVLDPVWTKAYELPEYESARRERNEKERMKALAIIKRTARVRTYAFLAHHMGLEKEDCHVAMMDIEQCRAAYRIMRRATYLQVRTWWKASGQSEKSVSPKESAP